MFVLVPELRVANRTTRESIHLFNGIHCFRPLKGFRGKGATLPVRQGGFAAFKWQRQHADRSAGVFSVLGNQAPGGAIQHQRGQHWRCCCDSASPSRGMRRVVSGKNPWIDSLLCGGFE